MRRADSPWWSAGFTKQWWKGLDQQARKKVLDTMEDSELIDFFHDWRVWARDNQLAPEGVWTTWLLMAGRGFGKTRTGNEWLRDSIETGGMSRFALVGQGEDDIREVMIEGEALALDTPIPTPDGWTRFGDLVIGDEIFARDGSVTTVAVVTPVWEERPCYALIAANATPIVADARHKWVATSRAERRDNFAGEAALKTTQDMAANLTKYGPGNWNFELPMHGALDLPDAELPIPPYTLGAWLGDGASRAGTLTCHHADAETISHIRADGFEVRMVAGNYAWSILKLAPRLKAAGLRKNKHVPAEYLRASRAQRHALLCGLMDTDGYVSDRGQISFDNTDLALVVATRELMLTLGYKPGAIQSKPDKRGFKVMYRVTLTCSPENEPPFRLRRKFNRCKPGKRPNGRLVRSIDRVPSVPVRCIQVDHPSGTFLAGEDFVVTHNSGLLNIARPDMRPIFRPAVGSGRLIYPNGAMGYVYSAADPESLRGPQFEAALFDEPMAVPAENRQKAVSNLKFGLRLGPRPRLVYTTTPKPHRWLREEVAKAQRAAIDPKTGAELPMEQRRYILTRGTTFDNAENLPASFFEGIIEDFDGTNLGRQEIYAEILGEEEGALWSVDMLDKCRITAPIDPVERLAFLQQVAQTCDRVVVGVDPNMRAASKTSHAAGIVVCGRRGSERFVIDDRSVAGGPAAWSRAAVKASEDFDADEIVAEVNQGGDMVRMVVQAAAQDMEVEVKVHKVHATKGKTRRAEPVAQAYERGMVKHVGHVGSTLKPGPFFKLEMQMCAIHEGTDPTGEDFDRADAMVWGMTRLGLKKRRLVTNTSGAPNVFTFGDFDVANAA